MGVITDHVENNRIDLDNQLIYVVFFMRLVEFVVTWPTKIAVTRSIFEIQGSSFGFSPLFIGFKNGA